MELEETSNAISSFLKRYRYLFIVGFTIQAFILIYAFPSPLSIHRATYETEVKKGKEVSTGPSEPKYMAGNADIYDLATSLAQNRIATTPNAVLEFMADCYTAMWQSLLRNGKIYIEIDS